MDNYQPNCGCGNSVYQPNAKVNQNGRYPVFSLRWEF
jgi:hypothetical protein